MEVITFCVTLTIIMAACLVAFGYIVGRVSNDNESDDVNNKSMDERKPVLDSNNVSDVRSRDRSRSDNQSVNQRMDADTAKNALTVMRMSSKYCDTEKAAIDYAMGCIDVAQKLSKYFKEDAE